MTKHVHATFITNVAIAANNRGETEGNITTLQKIMWKNDLYTTVSAEAIRFALRYYWQQQYQLTGDEAYAVNRSFDGEKFTWIDETYADGGELYIDDDALGYMDAKAPKQENGDEMTEEVDEEKKKKPGKKQGNAKVRRGALEVSRAISLLPFLGETSFNSKAGVKGSTSLYGTEMHATSYQYSISLTPHQLKKPERVPLIIEALASLNHVGGNQSRFLFDFSPQLAIYRITHDPAPRIMFVGEAEGNLYTLYPLIERIESGDIAADELIIGGKLASSEAEKLQTLGVNVCKGVVQASDMVKAMGWA